MWYRMYREDTCTPGGKIVRQKHNIRLGPLSELPTRSSALQALSQKMAVQQKPSTGMTFSELVERWKTAVVPTIKTTTATYYQKLLRAHLVVAFGRSRISSIGRYEVETFLANQAMKYSRNSLRGMRVSLGRVFS